MKAREKIDLKDSPMDLIVKMSEGNPGAISALVELLKNDPSGLLLILGLDDMGMRGSQIYVAFNDYCKRDVEAFRKAITDRDKEMVAVVNRECPDKRAVCHGASFA